MHLTRMYYAAMRAAQIRKAKGLTQADLAHLVGVEQGTISKFENGNDGITLGVVREIAKAMGVQVADLFAEDRTDREQLLIEAFRQMPDQRQLGWIDQARLSAADYSASA